MMVMASAPLAAYPAKAYPLELMEKALRDITARHPGCRLFLFGGGGAETAVLNEFSTKFDRCVNATAQLGGIDLELILMSHLDVMVSMDGANMQMASIAGAPVVSVWGATHPNAGQLGWGQDLADVVQADMPCRPCSMSGKKACLRGDMLCMKSIPPGDIAAKVEEVLRRRRHL